MTIFLMVLKIIGWILLVLLLLVLVLFLLVLFVPVRYRASVKMHDQIQAAVRASWLFPMLRFVMDYADGGIAGKFYVLCFPVMKFPQPEQIDNPNSTQKKAPIAEANEPTEEEFPHKEQPSGSKTDDSPKPKQPKKKKSVSIFARIRDFFNSVLDMLKNIREFIAKVKALLTDEKNQSAFSHLKREVVYLLKKSVPRRLKAQMVYSTGSPDTTGEVLGIIAMFPAAYKNRWNIVPDFEADHFYVDGEADISGRIFIYQLAGIILRILRDKNCRRLFIKLKG